MRRIVHGDPVVEFVGFHLATKFSTPIGLGVQKRIGDDWQTVGGVVFDDYNRANVVMHVAATDSHWLTREFLWMVFDYPFTQLEVRRVTAPVAEVNHRSRRFVENIGFKLEFQMEDAHPRGAMLIYKMTRSDCRWLHLRKPNGKRLAIAAACA